jgi:2-polyprenyl-3-methyl-5-hydroxy-6-metoxy-1,4-benzoquinol methylase
MSTKCHGKAVLQLGDLWAIDCARCGYVHRHPLPPPQEQADAYRAIYGRGDADLLEQRECDQWYWRLVFAERMREFERLVGDLPRKGTIPGHGYYTILDWGAGCGRFTDFVCREEAVDWVAWGYEPCEEAIAMADIPMVLFPAHPFHLKPHQFHAVHCSLVLEHVRDPLTELRQMRGMLMDGGVLCVVVPNEFNKLQQRLAERWQYSPFAQIHFNYFTPASLRALLRRAGFEVLATEATFPIEWFALNTPLNYVKRPKLGRWAHRLRMLFEAGLLVGAPGWKRRLYGKWEEQGVGREVVVWARKVK